MDLSADIASIVAQAPEWNFAGDCALLDLMKNISKNLEERSEHTSQKLREFETNVRRLDIALDNATNSLRSLQFGQQFVEYRVEEVEDDDFIMPEDQKKKPEAPQKSSQEMANEFLQNNLKMFRKNFEPVTIEVPDSDDEEDGAANTTTVFRAKNPYDAIPLPYIIGSKEWLEHKHAGLYDSSENSEDEQPEQFSSSSSDELETAAAPVAPMPTPRSQPVETQLSDSSSLASLPKEPMPRLAAAQPVVTPAACTKAQPRPIISSQRNPHESDLFQALRASPPSDDPPSTSSSLNSSPAISQRHPSAHNLPRADQSLSSSSSSASKAHFAGRQSPPKLFDEPIRVAAAAAVAPVPAPAPIEVPIKQESEVKPVAAASQIKRKPVNLFNDDEFNSFMSEIVDKVQSKSGTTPVQAKEVPKAPAQKLPKEMPPRNLNLFDESPPISPKVRQPPAVAATPAKPLPTSLFDDNLDDDVDDFLSAFTPKPKPQLATPKNSLFDDDDDLDIDDIFAKKKPSIPQLASKTIAKTSLFDDDDEDNANDIFGATPKPIKQAVRQQQEQKEPATVVVEPSIIQRKSLFDDIGDDDLFGTPKSNKQLFVDDVVAIKKKTVHLEKQSVQDKPKTTKEVSLEPQTNNIVKPIENSDLFADDFIDEKPIKISSKEQHETLEATKGTPEPTLKIDSSQKADLFSDDFSDEASTKSSSKDKPKTLEKPKDLPPRFIPKANLFNDDFSDEEPILSSLPKHKDEVNTTKEILENKTEQKSQEIKIMEEVKEEDTLSADLEATNKEETKNLPQVDDLLTDPKDNLKEEDPIISAVADVTNKKLNMETETSQPPPAEDVAAAQQIMQNYSSLFSDEPPDDSEFFQTLGTSSLSSLSASKLFDSAQDFFEPNLPDLPTSAVGTPAEQPNKDYGGMHLFSDVPPEDDDDAQQAAKAVVAPAAPDASTKRIHTIFYDDFSETARAGGEQPPIDTDVVDKSASKPSSPIKKLQMPNININVKALLPGGGALPKVIKKQADASPDPPAATVIPAPKSASNETDSILQCISKTRVRGPAHRRPSTRRARQENYAKSLLKEHPDEAAPESTANIHSKPAELSLEADLRAQSTSQKAPAPLKERLTKSASFLDSDLEDDDDDALFGKALAPQPPADDIKPMAKKVSFSNPPPAAVPLQTPSFLDSDDEEDQKTFPYRPPSSSLPPYVSTARANTGPPKSYVSFLDNNEDDEDFLFSPAAVAPAKTAKAEPQPKPSSFLDSDDDDDALFKPATKSQAAAPVSLPVKKPLEKAVKPNSSKLFDDSDDDDDLFGSAAAPIAKSQPKPTPNPAAVPAASQASLFDSSSEGELPKSLVNKSKLPAKPSRSLFSDDDDDDDDLFGGGVGVAKSRPVISQAKIVKTAPRNVITKAPQKTQAKPLPASVGNVSDNPLADLLGP